MQFPNQIHCQTVNESFNLEALTVTMQIVYQITANRISFLTLCLADFVVVNLV